MNKKTLEAIARHGNALLAAFPNSIEQDPVALCKKLRRIETTLEKPIVGYCNGTVNLETVDGTIKRAKDRVIAIFGEECVKPLFINCDPRGYALKFDDEWVRNPANNAGLIHKDWGGYGILAPDLTA